MCHVSVLFLYRLLTQRLPKLRKRGHSALRNAYIHMFMIFLLRRKICDTFLASNNEWHLTVHSLCHTSQKWEGLSVGLRVLYLSTAVEYVSREG